MNIHPEFRFFAYLSVSVCFKLFEHFSCTVLKVSCPCQGERRPQRQNKTVTESIYYE